MEKAELQELLSRFGTPAFIYDERVLADRIGSLRERIPAEVDLCYAVKANTFIIPCAAKYVTRLEVCSPGEYDICKKYGISAKQMVISGVNKTEEYVVKVVTDAVEESMQGSITAYSDGEENAEGVCGGIYTVESVSHAEILEKAAETAGVSLCVLLRLSSGNQFGMDEEELTDIIRYNKTKYPHLYIKGIQYFSGTQKHSLKKITREITYANDFIDRVEAETGFCCEELEYGTGFPVFYFQSEEFDEDAFLKSFSEIIKLSSEKRKTTLEIGRSIAAGCGTYVSAVADLKTVKGQNYAILDGGINQLVYYGQTMAMKHPHYELYRKSFCGGTPLYQPEQPGHADMACEEKLWNLCGSLCTINDILVKQLPVRDLKKGDVFAFQNTGAYSATEGIALFLSRQLPRVVLIKESGEYKLARDVIETSGLNS